MKRILTVLFACLLAGPAALCALEPLAAFFKEGIAAGVELAKTQGGSGSESRTGQIMRELVSYGSAAREAVPGLRELIVFFNAEGAANNFPKGELNNRRINDVEEAIEAAQDHPELRSIPLALK